MKKTTIDCSKPIKEQKKTISLTEDEIAENVAKGAAIEAQKSQEDISKHNESIDKELKDADAKIIRALTEGDTVRINKHIESQAILRAKKK